MVGLPSETSSVANRREIIVNNAKDDMDPRSFSDQEPRQLASLTSPNTRSGIDELDTRQL
jgi:hypothetical protein